MSLSKIEDFFPPVGRKEKIDHDKDEIQEHCPRREYYTVLLGELTPGPQRVTFMSRIVSIYQHAYSKASKDKPSCLKLVVKDDSGWILINLWHADVDYNNLMLGTLVSIWATHISTWKGPGNSSPRIKDNTTTTFATPNQKTRRLMTSIFPEKERGSRILVHQRSDIGIMCRMPLGYREGHPFSSLDSVNDAYDKAAAGQSTKVLVFVTAVGAVKQHTNAKNQTVQKVEVGIATESEKSVLTLYGAMISAVSTSWKPNYTILLISNANWRRTWSSVFVNSQTFVEVDPDIMEAEWLRKYAENTAVYVNQPFPEGVFDIERFEACPNRIKFTLADIDEFARACNNEFMGYVCILITEVNLVTLYRANHLFCAECCYMPVFSNDAVAVCGQCNEEVNLRINPRIIGSVMDETGMILCSSSSFHSNAHSIPNRKLSHGKASSPLLWSTYAMYQLLGFNPAGLLNNERSSSVEPTASLRMVEAELTYSRITALFGWYPRNGKVAICKVIK